MSTLAQITLMIACACLVDCRFLKRFHEHLPDDHHQAVKTNARDADAVVFPSDDDSHRITDDSKINRDIKVKNPNVYVEVEVKDDKENVADIVTPLISQIIPEVEVKDVFINPVSDKAVTDKIINDNKIDILLGNLNAEFKNDSVKNDDKKIIQKEAHMNDTVANSNETVPDLSSRFGGPGNYMLVPVAANVQNYQSVQSNPVPITNAQGIMPTQTNANTQFTPSNVGPNMQYVTPNTITNIGATLQAANIASNKGAVQLANTANFAQGTNAVAPVNVPNTYIINGQMYAAVTVSNNGNVPSALYYVNPQVGYQVANNMPLYKLMSVNGANQLQTQ